MASIQLHIHPSAIISWGKLSELAGTSISVSQPIPGNGGEPAEPMGLAMADPDGEVHVYVFGEGGKENLIRQLTGGVIVP